MSQAFRVLPVRKANGFACAQGALTIAIRYSAQRQQFGPPEAPEISVLDYQSQRQKLLPLLATCYGLHFTRGVLVGKYEEAKATKDDEIVADVHAMSAGEPVSRCTSCRDRHCTTYIACGPKPKCLASSIPYVTEALWMDSW